MSTVKPNNHTFPPLDSATLNEMAHRHGDLGRRMEPWQTPMSRDSLDCFEPTPRGARLVHLVRPMDNRQDGPLLVNRGPNGGTVIEGTAGADRIDVQRDPMNPQQVIVRCGKQTIVLGAHELPLEINAGDGNDHVTVDASLRGVKVRGQGGDDRLEVRNGVWGQGGRADFEGGAGNDTLRGGAGNDRLDGGAGHDVMMGLGGDDEMNGGSGADRMFGGAGNDKMLGGKGCDVMDGGAGDDHMEGQDGRDRLYGRGGNDTIHGGNANDYIEGGAGDDHLDGGRHRDTVKGGAGDDLVKGGHGRDKIWGGSGNDTLQGGPGKDEVHGGSGYDTATGERGKVDLGDQRWEPNAAMMKKLADAMRRALWPTINPRAGEPTTIHPNCPALPMPNPQGLIPLPGGDPLPLGLLPPGVIPPFVLADGTRIQAAGQMVATTKDGKTTIHTTEGADMVKVMRDPSPANPGGLLVYCNGSCMRLNAQQAKGLTINTYGGDDYVALGAGVSGVTVNGGAGDDTLISDQCAPLLPWLRARGNTLNGGAGNDRLVGGDGDDTLRGGAGRNIIFGRGGNDFIDASGGQNYVDGGAGRDFIWAVDRLFGWLTGPDVIQADWQDSVHTNANDRVRRRRPFLFG